MPTHTLFAICSPCTDKKKLCHMCSGSLLCRRYVYSFNHFILGSILKSRDIPEAERIAIYIHCYQTYCKQQDTYIYSFQFSLMFQFLAGFVRFFISKRRHYYGVGGPGRPMAYALSSAKDFPPTALVRKLAGLSAPLTKVTVSRPSRS